MQWINELKIAVINQDAESLERLSQNFPQNFSQDELLQAKELYEEAIKILKSKKETLGGEIRKLKEIKKYIGDLDY